MRQFNRFAFASSLVTFLGIGCGPTDNITLQTPPPVTVVIELPPSQGDAGSEVTVTETGDATPAETPSEASPTDVASSSRLIVTADPDNTYPSRIVYKGEPSVGTSLFYLNAVDTNQVVEQISFKHVGVGPLSDFSAVWLTTDYPLGLTRCTIDETDGVVTCGTKGSELKTVTAGTKSGVTLWVDYTQTAQFTAHHSFSLASATDVVTRDPTTVVSGSFPFNGNVFAVSYTAWTQLAVTYNGSPAAIVAGAESVRLFYYTLTANDFLLMRHQHFSIASTDGGRVVGSKGTQYFTNFRTEDVSNDAPLQASVGYSSVDPSGLSALVTTSEEPINLTSSKPRLLAIVADVVWMQDGPNELMGHSYTVTLQPYGDGEVVVTYTTATGTTETPLLAARINLPSAGLVSTPIYLDW